MNPHFLLAAILFTFAAFVALGFSWGVLAAFLFGSAVGWFGLAFTEPPEVPAE